MVAVSSSRRVLLRWMGAGAGSLMVGSGCADPVFDNGSAYAAWQYPDGSLPVNLRLVHAALLAASPHNTQPWAFVVREDQVEVRVDHARSLGAMDPLGRERMMGVGAALENLRLAAWAHGREPRVALFPDAADGDLVARVTLDAAPAALGGELHDAIPHRHTHRGLWRGDPLGADILRDAAAVVADVPDVTLHLWTDAERKAVFPKHTVAATQAIVDDRAMLHASDRWYRHRLADVERHRDGVTLYAQQMDPLLTGMAMAAPRPTAGMSGAGWVDATKTKHCVRVSSYGCLTTPDLQDRTQHVHAGMAYQRFHLWCTARGVAVQPLNQLAELRDRDVAAGTVGVHTERLQGLVPAGAHAQMLFRVGYAADEARPSPRRPVDWVVRS